MRKTILVLFGLLFLVSFVFAEKVFINEIRANDASADDIEFIELIGSSEIDITGYKIVHHNGSESSNTKLWSHTIGSFTFPDDGDKDNEGSALGYYVLGDLIVGNSDEIKLTSYDLQNGPDGIILYDASDNILDAVAWEGAGDLDGDDPGTVSISVSNTANNYLHVTPDDDSGDNSIQAPNNVIGDDGSGWVVAVATPGTINSGQASGDISLPVTLSSFTATPEKGSVLLKWITQSEVNNLGFNILKSLDDGKNFSQLNSALISGSGSTSEKNEYQYIDRDVIPELKYWYKLEDVDTQGNRNVSNVISAIIETNPQEVGLTSEFYLSPAYPNPCNPTTRISYRLPKTCIVNLSIYDIRGNLVKTLINRHQSAGEYSVQWSGVDNDGRCAGNGIYIYQLITDKGHSSTGKIVMLK